MAKRYAVYYLGTAVSGALSGLLAGVIVEYLDGARGIAGWVSTFSGPPVDSKG